jgi:transposase InsO family protein
VDLVGPLPISPQGYSYVLTAVDMFSKYLISIPLANKDTITIASSLTKYGVCNTLISDRGTEFTSACMAEVCRQLCISQEFTPSYVHHCLGACERSHGTLEERLSSYVNKNSNNWVDFLSSNTFSIDQSVNKGNNKITELRTILQIRVKTKLPNSEQSYKGKVKTHKYTNRQNQSTTGKL